MFSKMALMSVPPTYHFPEICQWTNFKCLSIIENCLSLCCRFLCLSPNNLFLAQQGNHETVAATGVYLKYVKTTVIAYYYVEQYTLIYLETVQVLSKYLIFAILCVLMCRTMLQYGRYLQ